MAVSALLAGMTSAFAAPPVTVLHAELVQISAPTQPRRSLPDAPLDELRLQAFGRRFDLTLQPNDRLAPLLADSDLQLYRGALRDTPGSWARLAYLDGRWQGLLWDGETLYAIEPAAQMAPATTGRAMGANATSQDTAMFRLDDTLVSSAMACSAAAPAMGARNGARMYDALMDELASLPATDALRQLDISVLADPALLAIHGSESLAHEAIARRLNNVDGIFSEQLGIQIRATLMETTTQLPPTTDPKELLEAVGALRRASPALHARGLTHLFTGRDLDGDIVGNAYVGTLCDVQTSAGLTEARGGTAGLWHESLVAAHEIAHNFGAVHDGEGACDAVAPDQYLMAPDTAGNHQFSSCSLDMMQHKLANAACISALPLADAALDATLGETLAPVGQSFDWQVAVRNVGGLAIARPELDIQLAPALAVEAADVPGGTCTSGAGVISCELDDIAGNSTHTVRMRLRAAQTGSYPARARVTASNDTHPANNFSEGTLRITEAVDLGLRLGSPDAAQAGVAFDLRFTASNPSAVQIENASLRIALPAAITQAELSLTDARCERSPTHLDCALPPLAAQGQLTGELRLLADQAGTVEVQAELDAGLFDPSPGDNQAAVTLTVSPTGTASTSSTSGRGGGGGSIDPSWLAALAGLFAWRARARLKAPTPNAI